MELLSISGLTLRRAMFAVLLNAGRPITVGEVVETLHAEGVTTYSWTGKPTHRVVADMLAYPAALPPVARAAERL